MKLKRIHYVRDLRVAEGTMSRLEVFYPAKTKSYERLFVRLFRQPLVVTLTIILMALISTGILLWIKSSNGASSATVRNGIKEFNITGSKEAWLNLVLSRERELQRAQANSISKIISSSSKSASAWELGNLIVRESRDHGIDPFLVTAIIKTESLFKPDAVSPMNARGLMQVQPLTAKFVRRNLLNPEGLSRSDFDPTTNVRLGIRYFKYLQALFKGRFDLALMAYNWGPAKVERAQRSGRLAPRAVRRYAEQILRDAASWKANK